EPAQPGALARLGSCSQQAATCGAATSKAGGCSASQGSKACLQRAQNAQPAGNMAGEGTRPGIASSRCPTDAAWGKPPNNARVYGCAGRLKMSRTLPCST